MTAFTDKDRKDAEATGHREAMGVIVLGAGRSGTSAITRSFLKSGFFAGRDEDLYPANRGNPLGHFEPLSVLEVNEELLEKFGCTWWADFPPSEEQLSQQADVAPRLKSILDDLIASADGAPIVVKEPRINGLLPLWGPVIGGVLHPVLAIRDPVEVALSHAHRDETPISHALAAWEAQMALVLHWLDGQTVTIAPYAQLIARPELAKEIVGNAAKHLDPGRAGRIRPANAGSALEPALHQQRAVDVDYAEYLTGRQAVLWDYLSSLSVGDVQLKAPEQLGDSRAAHTSMRRESEWIQLHQAYASLTEEHSKAQERAMGLGRDLADVGRRLAEMGELARQEAAKADRFARELEGVRASASWRITAPLRRLKQARHVRARGRPRDSSNDARR
ncbi:MAG TPA: hypothetical protein VF176_00220 [Solirubrobacterales bacterium]